MSKTLEVKNTYFPPKIQTYIPNKTEPPQTCGIKKFQNVSYTQQNENQFQMEGVSRRTTNISLIETTDLSCLKKFGLVQYIKGCVYNSQVDPKTGKIKKWFGHVRSFKGKKITYKHPDWDVDTLDQDPLYWSSEKYPEGAQEERLQSYLSPLKNWQFAESDELLWKQFRFFDYPKNNLKSLLEKPQPQYPILIATDLPVGSSFTRDEATNVFLQFQTCLYELEQIPLEGKPETPPLHCFEWSHQHVFNHQTKKFEEVKEMDPLCLQ